MSDSTKVAAADKLAKFNPKIGYPNKWEDYSKLTIKADDLVGNAMRASEVEHAKSLAKLGAPIDKDEWHMTPQTVNAYYNPTMNEIVFLLPFCNHPSSIWRLTMQSTTVVLVR